MSKSKAMTAALLLFTVVAPPAHAADPAYCFAAAGAEYHIAPQLLWTIAKHESGFRADAINRNKNGSYDYGVMQINSTWYKTLGPQRWAQLSDPCFNIRTGAWITPNDHGKVPIQCRRTVGFCQPKNGMQKTGN